MNDDLAICHHCGRDMRPGEGAYFVVRIEAFADPTPPTIPGEDAGRDHRGEIRRLVDQLNELSEQEAMDQVYRRLTLCLCNGCYMRWIEDPTGSHV